MKLFISFLCLILSLNFSKTDEPDLSTEGFIVAFNRLFPLPDLVGYFKEAENVKSFCQSLIKAKIFIYSDKFDDIFENFHNLRNQVNLKRKQGFEPLDINDKSFENAFYCKFNDLKVYALDIYLDTFLLILITKDSSSDISSSPSSNFSSSSSSTSFLSSNSTLKLIGAYMKPLQMKEFQVEDVFKDLISIPPAEFSAINDPSHSWKWSGLPFFHIGPTVFLKYEDLLLTDSQKQIDYMKIGISNVELKILLNTETRTLKLTNKKKDDMVQVMKVVQYTIIHKNELLAKFFIDPSYSNDLRILILDKKKNLTVYYYKYLLPH